MVPHFGMTWHSLVPGILNVHIQYSGCQLSHGALSIRTIGLKKINSNYFPSKFKKTSIILCSFIKFVAS